MEVLCAFFFHQREGKEWEENKKCESGKCSLYSAREASDFDDDGDASPAQLIKREMDERGKKEERKCRHNVCGCQKQAHQMALCTAGLCSMQLVEEGENGLCQRGEKMGGSK